MNTQSGAGYEGAFVDNSTDGSTSPSIDCHTPVSEKDEPKELVSNTSAPADAATVTDHTREPQNLEESLESSSKGLPTPVVNDARDPIDLKATRLILTEGDSVPDLGPSLEFLGVPPVNYSKEITSLLGRFEISFERLISCLGAGLSEVDTRTFIHGRVNYLFACTNTSFVSKNIDHQGSDTCKSTRIAP